MPAGRPTIYDPAMCETAVEYLAQGHSPTALAGRLGVARTTVYRWVEEHEEFRDAVKTGEALGAQWWEDRLKAIATGEDGNAAAAIFGLKNRARHDWRDTMRQEHTGANGGPIKSEVSASERLAEFLASRSS